MDINIDKAKLGRTPHDQKWELLKPVIWAYYQTHKLEDIVQLMSEKYKFVAQ